MTPLLELPPPPRPPRARYRAAAALPPYRYVPGSAYPHPTNDPRGHLFGRPPLESNGSYLAWMVDPAWLTGVDLYNHWYFWEAHEAWEPVWRALDKASPPGLFVQALMQCAGAVIKVCLGELEGVQALWGQAEVRLVQVTKVAPMLYGLRTKTAYKAFASYFKPAVTQDRLPALDKRLPTLKLAM